ncbi:hypothetical protein SAY87_023910 [Trapa incisa]|uniref:BHLH domain-containing protein n=1 Tax=Trapa incisa TaxID=236973 RepID=A0AAN7L208_9MYRT|nr:hypothetical protein SAY87_023910 [Trapa incisa]
MDAEGHQPAYGFGKFGLTSMGFGGSSGMFHEKQKLVVSPATPPQAYNTGLPPQYPSRSSGLISSSSMEGSYGAVGQVGVDQNLARQSSYTPDLPSHLFIQNGYTAMKGARKYRAGNGLDGGACPATATRGKGQLSLSSLETMLPQFSETRNECLEVSGPGDSGLLSNAIGRGHASGSVWGDSLEEDGVKLFSSSQSLVQNCGTGNRGHLLLSHHPSLPRSSIPDMEKLLQSQDSVVPWKIRAKRGCATHPRSIAERVRRTRISERMSKLKELVPKMDKQTNTADMLDLAVEHIKDLQEQYKALSRRLANCNCTSRQK